MTATNMCSNFLVSGPVPVESIRYSMSSPGYECTADIEIYLESETSPQCGGGLRGRKALHCRACPYLVVCRYYIYIFIYKLVTNAKVEWRAKVCEKEKRAREKQNRYIYFSYCLMIF